MDHKSPFIVVKEVLSPLQCEDMVKRLKHTSPNLNQLGIPTVTYKANNLSEIRISPIVEQLIPVIEQHYDVKIKSKTTPMFEWYPEGYQNNKATSEGYRRITKRGKKPVWQRVKNYDFTILTFLNDYNNETDFDEQFEFRGGKLEFPTHGFGFNAERGTVLIFPTRPNFAHAITNITAGNLNIIRSHLITDSEFEYNMDDYTGSYKDWF
jgi:hypothetical protein